jgi:hypothetical protein
MSEQDKPIPTDEYSLQLRSCNDDPMAVSRWSTIDRHDFYGNVETWTARTIRRDDGRELIFLQRIHAKGGDRLVIPAEVVDAIARHRSSIVDALNKRRARNAAATRAARRKP